MNACARCGAVVEPPAIGHACGNPKPCAEPGALPFGGYGIDLSDFLRPHIGASLTLRDAIRIAEIAGACGVAFDATYGVLVLSMPVEYVTFRVGFEVRP